MAGELCINICGYLVSCHVPREQRLRGPQRRPLDVAQRVEVRRQRTEPRPHAPLGRLEDQLWLIHLVGRLLEGDPLILDLMQSNPFPEQPPRAIRVGLYRYAFTRHTDGSSDWWTREFEGDLVRPLTLSDPALHAILAEQGWKIGD